MYIYIYIFLGYGDWPPTIKESHLFFTFFSMAEPVRSAANNPQPLEGFEGIWVYDLG